MKLSNIKPISFLKSDAARIVTELSETREPLIITQNGEAKLVVQDIASYEAQRQTTALLKILALGEKEIAEGKVTAAESVFAELDRLDEEDGA
ncbi:type II toxin-antitoxin system Phd/YefM family antitoxin [Cupriavidus sp. CV2]|uniref:type II toxin-antitoxin system Phd/YefM family antitoxin n=1 Tax=Cupriavidus ulmosensis TaxID=3065913 RepID=UPI00296B158A|nr:type II toxin-antitoxin system Phd/YefM family antitoxin [Cupriavidus sp. CV2]MDW3685707.1 type II toxin-antitoxin system Phd/YefM family antitoxin [Cupriavidus sp. CV2]